MTNLKTKKCKNCKGKGVRIGWPYGLIGCQVCHGTGVENRLKVKKVRKHYRHTREYALKHHLVHKTIETYVKVKPNSKAKITELAFKRGYTKGKKDGEAIENVEVYSYNKGYAKGLKDAKAKPMWTGLEKMAYQKGYRSGKRKGYYEGVLAEITLRDLRGQTELESPIDLGDVVK
jgi:hypothetical protein